jgi:hypothetical protein
MRTDRQPLRFAQHAMAVLAAALLGSTIVTLLSVAAMVLLAKGPLPGAGWLVGVTLACWFTIFILALPGVGITFTLLWPATRHGTAAGGWICVLAGATLGMVLAPLGAAGGNGATLTQIAALGGIGAVIGAVYVAFARRMAKGPARRPLWVRGFRHRLPPVTC